MYDDDLPEIPKSVLQQPHDKTDYLVRFYDKSDLWYVYQQPDTEHVNLTLVLSRAWIPPDMLRLLGEIDGEVHRFHAGVTPRFERLVCRT